MVGNFGRENQLGQAEIWPAYEAEIKLLGAHNPLVDNLVPDKLDADTPGAEN